MSFFTLSTGEYASGAAEKAHFTPFRVIPNNSKVFAVMTKCEKKQGKKPYYQLIWEVSAGQYTGVKVYQSIFPWADDAKMSDRAKEMFMRIFRCCGVKPPEMEPTSHELYLLEGKVCGIKVIEKTYVDRDGKDREKNEIIEIHLSKDFHEEIGEKIVHAPKESKPRVESDMTLDDDIPF